MQDSAAGPVVVPGKSVAAVKEALKRSGADQNLLPEAAQRAYTEGCKMRAWGRMIVVATLTGELHLYENAGAPQWA